MFSTAIIVFREVLEIALILGVVLAATRGVTGRMKWVLAGLAGGVAGSGLVALYAESISGAMDGMGQEMFNAVILFTAAFFIGWTVIWIRTHAREMTQHLKQAGQKVASGDAPLYTLSLIVGLAMLREGSEITLFIYGMIASGQAIESIASGALAGAGAGIVAGVLLYMGLIKLSTRYMLSFTSWLLMLLVAGLMAHGAGYLTAAGYFEALSNPVWNSAWLISEEGLLGQTLHALIGYTSEPTQIQLIFYGATLLGLWLATKAIARKAA